MTQKYNPKFQSLVSSTGNWTSELFEISYRIKTKRDRVTDEPLIDRAIDYTTAIKYGLNSIDCVETLKKQLDQISEFLKPFEKYRNSASPNLEKTPAEIEMLVSQIERFVVTHAMNFPKHPNSK